MDFGLPRLRYFDAAQLLERLRQQRRYFDYAQYKSGQAQYKSVQVAQSNDFRF
ncbi:hypothetical protein [Nostoc sp.]|uniref:hypothetical protein n=1 Tax=Nostoc sp. TaxID=1180 RepID=UPI002FFCF9B6